MNLNNLLKITTKSKKRIGRGHGSGKVKTCGRGTKGQKARGTMPLSFEGGQLSLIKRLPLLRGKMRNKSQQKKPMVISVGTLSVLPAGSEVTLETLRKYHMIDDTIGLVKILGKDALTVALTVALPCSKSARSAVEKAGGKVEDGKTVRR